MYLAQVPQPKSLPRVQQRLLQVELPASDLQNLLVSSPGQGWGWVWLLVLLYRKRNPRWVLGRIMKKLGTQHVYPPKPLLVQTTRNYAAEETEGFWAVSRFLMQIAHLLLPSLGPFPPAVSTG